jgi:putative ABC transport system permease protein
MRLFPRKQPALVSLGIIDLENDRDPETVKTYLNNYLADDVKAYTDREYVDAELDYIKSSTPIGFVFSLGTMIGFVVGIVVVYQVLSTDVNDHMAEYATFKAMGYKNSYLLGVVFEEALILSIIGFIPSVAIAAGLYRLTAIATALPIVLPASRAVAVFFMTIIMCSISGSIATRKLQSADPADIF